MRQVIIKVTLCVLLVCLAQLGLSAQQYKENIFGMYFHTGFVNMQQPEAHFTVGGGLQYFYSDLVSIETGIAFGSSYMRAPLMPMLGVTVYEIAALNWLMTGREVPRFVVLFFAESYSFHFPLSETFTVSLYLSPASFELFIPAAVNPESEYALTSASGVRLNFFSKKLFAGNVYGEYKYDYISRRMYPAFGLGLGVFFDFF